MSATGAGVTRLTSGPGFDIFPTWSKDGKRIAFTSTRASADPSLLDDDSTEVFAMNADGSGVTQLTFSPRQDAQPAWSPDGRQIAFVSARDLTTQSSTGEVYVMNVDGTQARRLTTLGGAVVSRVSWAPDGRRLAFGASPAGASALGFDVYAVNPDGTQLAQLTFDALSGQPSWSPDGNLIAFASSRADPTGSGELYTMRPDGTAATRLTISPADDLFPAWSR
jgi:TolB protein